MAAAVSDMQLLCGVQAAQSVCRSLGIPLHEADFVAEYWTRVFTDFVAQCGRGLTPNPDLACNRHIKFDALLRFAKDLGADAVATGHYARLRHCQDGAPSCAVQLWLCIHVEGADVLFLSWWRAAVMQCVRRAVTLPP